MIRRSIRPNVLLLIWISILSHPPVASASHVPDQDDIVATESNLMIQSIVVDTDIWMLGTRFPSTSAGSFTYTSTTDENGWQGTLTGSINGKSLVVQYYGGDQTSNPANLAESSGSLGGEAWTGVVTGSVVIEEEPALFGPGNPDVGVTIAPMEQTLEVGATLTDGSVTWSLSARKDFLAERLSIEGGVGLSAGVIPIVELSAGFDYDQAQRLYESFVEATVLVFWTSRKIVNAGSLDTSPPETVDTTMTVAPAHQAPTMGRFGIASLLVLLFAASLVALPRYRAPRR